MAGRRIIGSGTVLVQREMESGRAPLASIAPILRGSLHRRTWWRPAEGAATETATGFEKEIRLARHRPLNVYRGSEARLKAETNPRHRKTNWLRKNIEYMRRQAREQAGVPTSGQFIRTGGCQWSGRVPVSGLRR
jgi:hypothetical protein